MKFTQKQLNDLLNVKDYKKIKEIIDTQYDDERKENFLSSCSFDGHLEIVKYLIENGVAINDEALMNCTYYGFEDIFIYLVENGADIYTQNNRVIINVVERGCIEIMEYMYSLGCDLELMASYERGKTEKWIENKRLAEKLNVDLKIHDNDMNKTKI